MMSEERGARDRRSRLSVEGGRASGAASTFDGNHTSDVWSWLIPNEYFDCFDHEAMERSLDLLMERTCGTFYPLAWVLIAPGYRIR